MTIDPKHLFAVRIKQRRQELDLSQRELGIAAGFDEGVASTRINRYEVGVHSPDPLSAARIADALGMPLAALYCDDDQLHEVIKMYWLADATTQGEVRQVLCGHVRLPVSGNENGRH